MRSQVARAAAVGLAVLAALFTAGCAPASDKQGSVTITAQLQDGSPLEGCDAQFSGQSPVTEQGRITNSSGQVYLSAGPGAYSVTIRCAAGSASSDFKIVEGGDPVSLVLTI